VSQQDQEQQPDPVPAEPCHVMSRKKYEQMLAEQQK